MKAGMVIVASPTGKVSAPPTCHRTPMKMEAASSAVKMPMAKSVNGSMARRTSSEMRYSGLASPFCAWVMRRNRWSPIQRSSNVPVHHSRQRTCRVSRVHTMPTPTAAALATSSRNTPTARPASMVSRLPMASKNQRFH